MPNDLDHGIIETIAAGKLTPTMFSTVEKSGVEQIDIQGALRSMAGEIRRRRAESLAVDAEIPAIERFISKPVNRISHPMLTEALERLIEAHRASVEGL
jgi:hypothetical protein